MTEQFRSVPVRPGGGTRSRSMILTFSAERPVRTERGAVRAEGLCPGDRLLSGASGGMSVLDVFAGRDDGPDGGRPVVRVVVGQPLGTAGQDVLPVVGRVSPQDGRLHLGAVVADPRPH